MPYIIHQGANLRHVNREADFQLLCVLQALVLSEIMLFLDLQLYVG